MNFVEGMRLPQQDELSAPFWQGCRDGVLRLQQCQACGHWQFYPRPLCTNCGSVDALEWRASGGVGRLASYSEVHLPVSPAYTDAVPYIVALVELDEGPRLMTNMLDCVAQELTVGQRVRVVFRERTPDITLPFFTPAD